MLKWLIFVVKWRIYGYEWQSFFDRNHTTRADMYPTGCQSVGACLPVVIIIGDVWGGGEGGLDGVFCLTSLFLGLKKMLCPPVVAFPIRLTG